MVDFDNALEKALVGATAAFKEADEDLHHVVVQASQSVARITNGTLELGLDRLDEDFQGTTYALQLAKAGAQNPTDLGLYRVQTRGYPILFGPPADSLAKIMKGDVSMHFKKDAKAIHNRDLLLEHFLQLLSSPDSPLVINIAFAIRKQSHDQDE